MNVYEYDLVVIGSGPGGYVAAIRGAQLKLKTLVIEKDKAGGVCLNVGCIPTKALIERASLFNQLSELKSIGIKTNPEDLNYSKVQKKAATASKRLSKGIKFLLEKNGVDYLEGTAVKIESHIVTMEQGRTISCKNILLATGSRPKSIPGFEIDENLILSSTGLLAMTELPKSLLILGSGAIGIEFAYIMNSFGVNVTVVEVLNCILPLEDAEISESMESILAKQGIKFLTGTKALSVAKNESGIILELDGDQSSIEADKLLVAVGRTPNTDSLGLGNTGIKIDQRGFIETGDYYETTAEGIYAIGDIVKSPLLAHVASKEGEIAVEHMAEKNSIKKIDIDQIPSAVYCEPQVASFGISSQKAETGLMDVVVSRFPFRANGKATATGHSEGFVKIISSKEGDILGAHICGHNASEMLHELLLAKENGLGIDKISEMIHIHPSLSESLMEAAKEAFDGAIHI